jgi:hypothetical protein
MSAANECSRAGHLGLLLIVLLACGLRCAVAFVFQADLTNDRDAYLGIAAGVREGRGYSVPGSDQPTAYRPPLYPLVLAANPLGDVGWWVAVINIAAGAATVALTAVLGRRLGLAPFTSLLAAGLVAIDPLLLRYTAQPMTECLCTLLTTLLLVAARPPTTTGSASVTLSHQREVAIGVIFGLAALCRPTIWAWGILVTVAVFWNQWRQGRAFPSASTQRMAPTSSASDLRLWSAIALGVALVIAPWGLRNWLEFDTPIITTTHGGYTFVLGNNPAFYAEVVRQPLVTEWDGSRGPGQAGWVEALQQRMRDAGVVGEVAQDRWMSREAWTGIADDPAGFLLASWQRGRWFWNAVPRGEAAADAPEWLLLLIGLGYAIEFAAAMVGVTVILCRRDARWRPALLLVVAFTLVHLVYWSNVRMRAPLVPVIALVASVGCELFLRRIPILRGKLSANEPAGRDITIG